MLIMMISLILETTRSTNKPNNLNTHPEILSTSSLLLST